jgi:PIN domain nuclease of toxin-antitoxin system
LRLLLDTHVLLWWLSDNRRLGATARAAVGDPDNDVYVSAATVWECALKRALGKLTVPDDLSGEIQRSGFDALPIGSRHAEAAGALPRHHDDPFDRMLVAQAMEEGLTLTSADPRFGAYDVPMLPAGRR